MRDELRAIERAIWTGRFARLDAHRSERGCTRRMRVRPRAGCWTGHGRQTRHGPPGVFGDVSGANQRNLRRRSGLSKLRCMAGPTEAGPAPCATTEHDRPAAGRGVWPPAVSLRPISGRSSAAARFRNELWKQQGTPFRKLQCPPIGSGSSTSSNDQRNPKFKIPIRKGTPAVFMRHPAFRL